MNLDYSVLWFEDNDGWLESARELVASDVEKLGFRLRVRVAKDGTNLAKLMARPDLDLVVMDYKLEGTTGDQILKQIREKRIYTECVFYSANPIRTLRDAVAKREIDGVYCATRDDFQRVLIEVIRTTIKKAQDLNSVRGLVMATSSDFDSRMTAIICDYHAAQRLEAQAAIRTKIEGVLLDQGKERQKELEKIKVKPLTDLVRLFAFDSFMKWRTVKSFLEPKKDALGDVWTKILEYERLINFRNKLGHVKSERNDETGETKIAKLEFKGKDFELSDDHCSDLRRELQAHHENFEAIRKHLIP